jgi:hypothetical protein
VLTVCGNGYNLAWTWRDADIAVKEWHKPQRNHFFADIMVHIGSPQSPVASLPWCPVSPSRPVIFGVNYLQFMRAFRS